MIKYSNYLVLCNIDQILMCVSKWINLKTIFVIYGKSHRLKKKKTVKPFGPRV